MNKFEKNIEILNEVEITLNGDFESNLLLSLKTQKPKKEFQPKIIVSVIATLAVLSILTFSYSLKSEVSNNYETNRSEYLKIIENSYSIVNNNNI
jgi:hypothetical protein